MKFVRDSFYFIASMSVLLWFLCAASNEGQTYIWLLTIAFFTGVFGILADDAVK